MPVLEKASATAAPDPADPGAGALLVMTSLGALDGTVLLLAAQGALSSWLGALAVGLTVTAGAGAWITARQAFGGRPRTARDWTLLALVAVLAGSATVAAAWLGGWIGQSVPLHVLPQAAGLILLAVAADVSGLARLVPGRVPLPAVAVLGALLAEGVVQWTL